MKTDINASNEDFLLSFTKKPAFFKLSVKVAKRVVKRAVDRNRIKRLIRESLKDLKIQNGEMIIRVKKNLAPLKQRDIGDSLRGIIRKIK